MYWQRSVMGIEVAKARLADKPNVDCILPFVSGPFCLRSTYVVLFYWATTYKITENFELGQTTTYVCTDWNQSDLTLVTRCGCFASSHHYGFWVVAADALSGCRAEIRQLHWPEFVTKWWLTLQLLITESYVNHSTALKKYHFSCNTIFDTLVGSRYHGGQLFITLDLH